MLGNLQGWLRAEPAGTRQVTDRPREFRFTQRSVLRLLFTGIALIVAASLVTTYLHYVLGYESVLGLVDQFDLDREGNLPAWFSAMMLTACAVLLFAIYLAKRRRRDAQTACWGGLAAIFLYLSVDEASGLHELTFSLAHAFFDLTGALYGGWMIPFGALLLVFAAFYLRFLLNLPRRFQVLFVLAGALYVGGAIGMELVSWEYRWSVMEATPGDFDAKVAASKDMTYTLLVIAEETMEMLGAAVFLHALLRYVAEGRVTMAVRFGERGGRPAPAIAIDAAAGAGAATTPGTTAWRGGGPNGATARDAAV